MHVDSVFKHSHEKTFFSFGNYFHHILMVVGGRGELCTPTDKFMKSTLNHFVLKFHKHQHTLQPYFPLINMTNCSHYIN